MSDSHGPQATAVEGATAFGAPRSRTRALARDQRVPGDGSANRPATSEHSADRRALGNRAKPGYRSFATKSISTSAPLGSAATCTVDLAGRWLPITSP